MEGNPSAGAVLLSVSGINSVVTTKCSRRICLSVGPPTMPRQKLPAKIRRNDAQPTTDAQAEAIGAIVEWYDRVDHLTEIAEKTDYSRSHVGQCYRKFFEPASDTAKSDVAAHNDEVILETPKGRFTCKSTDPEVRKAFVSQLVA